MGLLKRCNSDPSNSWSSKMPKGLELEISHHRLTMKKAANLIITMEKLKDSRSKSVLSTCFTDQDLLRIMLDDIEDEPMMEMCLARPLQFTLTGEHQWNVRDMQKRSLVLFPDLMELHAVLLQGGSSEGEVYLNMSTYVHPAPPVGARPVALGISDTKFYLSCHMKEEEPTLCLEEVEDKSILSVISDGSELQRFIFYKQDSGLSNTTLMSASFPNWYIGTAEEDNQAVIMCQETSTYNLTFDMLLKSATDF